MPVGNDSYRYLLAEWRKRDHFAPAFKKSLEWLADQYDFNSLKSCIAFGTGTGDRELEFARRLLPNLRRFVAVEPDHESAQELRQIFRNGKQLPGVEKSVMEMTVEDWNGVDKPADVALMFNVFYHVVPEDRPALIEKLKTKCMSPNGIVIIIENESSDVSGLMLLLKMLGNREYRYKDIEADMIASGYRLLLTHSIIGKRDLNNPTDGVVKYIQLSCVNEVSENEVRSAIAQSFSSPDMRIFNKRLGIFKL